MEVTNCRTCGRLFNSLSNDRVCPACKRQLEDKFQQVKAYLNENPNASVDAVSKENDVSIKQIKQWIREERLAFSDGSVDGIECEKCGKLIKTGRYCEECKGKVANNLMSALDKPAPVMKESSDRRDNKNKMRFL